VSGIWSCKLENRTEIISALEQNGLRIKSFRKPEQSDISEVLLEWFKGERNDNASVSGPILMITLIFLNFNFTLCVF